MKLALIFSYKENEIWSTPYSLACEFQARGWEVQIFSTLSTTGNYTDAGIQMMHDQITSGNYDPDIVFYLDWGRFDTHLLDKSLYSSAYWVNEAGDEWQNFTRNFPRAPRFNLTLTSDHPSMLKYKKAGVNAIWFPHFADTVIYRPITTPVKYDVTCTRGPGSSMILDQLQIDMGTDKMYNKNGTLGLAHAEALQKGKIIVQHSRWHEITRRIFEGMACGRMVITDRLPQETKLQDLFKENVDIVFYDDYEDLKRKLDYYLLHNVTEREKIANAGRKAVVKSHTQVHRVDTILKEFRKWKASQ